MLLTWEGYQDQEVIYPYYRVKEDGFEVDIFANKIGKIQGIMGTTIEATKDIRDLGNTYASYVYDAYDFMILPGGVKSLEKLRQELYVLDFIKCWDTQGKLIASTCHGAQLLISAKVVKNRAISGYYSIKDDIENAGATYVDMPAVVSQNIVSSPHYKHMGEWMKTALQLYRTIDIDRPNWGTAGYGGSKIENI